ncbi:MAG: lipid-binding SYLF domain-containing protein [Magnetovibrio sp.]|nr:lipid-binding SYLF domain-containing protein [Magnetovibrio sp.]
MISRLFRVLIVALALPLGACSTQQISDLERAQQIVGAASATLQKFKASQDEPMDDFRALLPEAEGLIILPGVIKGGFIFAAEGGSGVMLAKDTSGRWSDPAFYFLAAGSVGLQAGAQIGDVVLLVFSRDAVASIIKHQGKLGADLGLIIGTFGVGVEASTTTNIGADILAFTQGIGAFAGGSLEAAALIKRSDLNQAFYGQAMDPAAIVLAGPGQNSAADKLRAAIDGR